MRKLNLKPNHKPIQEYYATLAQFDTHNITHEGAVSLPLQTLLDVCAKKVNATFVPQYAMRPAVDAVANRTRIVIDGAILDEYKLPFAFIEAKDIHDDLEREIQRKFANGYPNTNIFFYTPQRGVLYQNGQKVLDVALTERKHLCTALERLFSEPLAAVDNWHAAVAEFRETVPALGREMTAIIQNARRTNPRFNTVFADFYQLCRASINPNLSTDAVEEMLSQHILTERTFRTVFNNPDFTRRNIIAREIENVIDVLTDEAFSRDEFLEDLNDFYLAIEDAARLCQDFSQKQHFLNTVYEQFFQGFSVKDADRHGIVYTPQPIVDFMVKSVAQILKNEFGRTLSDEGVHIIDAFVGTGNFIVRLMREIDKTALEHKYRHELHCNEVLLLPYYIASMNIEHEFYEATGRYLPFDKICLVDTFDLAESRQLPLLTRENTERAEKQKASPMFIVIGNPPYNVGQAKDSDNNRNRKHEAMDERVRETYVQDSAAQNKMSLYDAYVKGLRWASDRIGEEGIAAFVTNNSFLDAISADGLRKHLSQDFTKIYHVNLKGNARTSGEQRRKEGGNVFDDKVRVSVGITFLVKKAKPADNSAPAEVWLYHVDDYLKSAEKQNVLAQFGDYTTVPMKRAAVDANHTWLTEGLRPEFSTYTPIGSKAAKASKSEPEGVIFRTYGIGIATGRDNWICNFSQDTLGENMLRMIEFYNAESARWARRTDLSAAINDFVTYDDTKIKWSDRLRANLNRGRIAEYADSKIRNGLYRPYTKASLFFDRLFIDTVSRLPVIFPIPETEAENRVICMNGVGSKKPFHCLMTNVIPFYGTLGIDQCFPFYTYDEDGTNRRENITDWALAQFRAHYGDASIEKWDIFHYAYGLLHHPDYRERYGANLKRDLPHLPFLPGFWEFANAGKALAELHVNYEKQPVYPLRRVETPGMQLNWRVEKARLSDDKTCIHYNDFLTLEGIPMEAFAYQLGTYSALEWVLERYQVTEDDASGIVNNANRADAPSYIVDLIGRVLTVSLETVRIVGELPGL